MFSHIKNAAGEKKKKKIPVHLPEIKAILIPAVADNIGTAALKFPALLSALL